MRRIDQSIDGNKARTVTSMKFISWYVDVKKRRRNRMIKMNVYLKAVMFTVIVTFKQSSRRSKYGPVGALSND